MKKSSKHAARDRDILRLYRSGLVLEEVGLRYRITRERVRQILDKLGYRLRHGHKTRGARRRAATDAKIAGWEKIQAASHADLARRLGVSAETLRRRKIEVPRKLLPCGTYAAAKRHHYRREKLCEPCRLARNAYMVICSRKRNS